jgi:hypothetical protein
LRQNAGQFCGKTPRILRQNATRFAAKRNAICRKSPHKTAFILALRHGQFLRMATFLGINAHFFKTKFGDIKIIAYICTQN